MEGKGSGKPAPLPARARVRRQHRGEPVRFVGVSEASVRPAACAPCLCNLPGSATGLASHGWGVSVQGGLAVSTL